MFALFDLQVVIIKISEMKWNEMKWINGLICTKPYCSARGVPINCYNKNKSEWMNEKLRVIVTIPMLKNKLL